MKFRPTSGERAEAEEAARESIEEARKFLDAGEDVQISLGYTEHPFTLDVLDGVVGQTFSNKIEVYFNTDVEGWRKTLKRVVAHEYAHTHFFDSRNNREKEKLFYILLAEAQSTNLAEKTYPDVKTPTTDAVEQEELENLWPKVREKLATKMSWDNDILMGREEFPQYTGYTIAFRIGKELLNQGFEIEDFPELGKEEVIKTGDKLFDIE